MFTAEQRLDLRSSLLDQAAQDPRITAAAVTGSAAIDNEDPWSDIDLAFGVADADQVEPALRNWTALMYEQHRAVHHLDVKAGAWIYRVFLLPSTLQVDLAFVPAAEFRALGPTFRLVFGKENQPAHAPPQKAEDIIGLGWLYALHARSCIARRRLWQAEYMISGIRDHALALACIRHGLQTAHGRGVDQLPRRVTDQFEGSLVRQVEIHELLRAFQSAVQGLLGEVRECDPVLEERLRDALMQLTRLEIGV